MRILIFTVLVCFLMGVQQKLRSLPSFQTQEHASHTHEIEGASFLEMAEAFFLGHFEHAHSHHEESDESSHEHSHQHNLTMNFAKADFLSTEVQFYFHSFEQTWQAGALLQPVDSDRSEILRPPISSVLS